MVGFISLAGIALSAALVIPLAIDFMNKQPLGTTFSTIGSGIFGFGMGTGRGIQELLSRSLSPQIRPAFVPEIGFRLDVPCFGHQVANTPTYNFEYISSVREGRLFMKDGAISG